MEDNLVKIRQRDGIFLKKKKIIISYIDIKKRTSSRLILLSRIYLGEMFECFIIYFLHIFFSLWLSIRSHHYFGFLLFILLKYEQNYVRYKRGQNYIKYTKLRFRGCDGIHEYPENLRWKSIARKFWPSISLLILARRLRTFLPPFRISLNFLRFRTLK